MKKIIVILMAAVFLAPSTFAVIHDLELKTNERVIDITTSISDPTMMIAVGDNNTIRTSTDMGKTFTSVDTSAIGTGITMKKVAYPTGTVAYAGGYYTDPSGNTSSRLIKIDNGTVSNATKDLGDYIGVINDVMFKDADTGFVVGNKLTYSPPMYDGTITTSTAYKYTSGSWSKLGKVPTTGDTVAIDAVNGNKFAIIQNYTDQNGNLASDILLTLDGGANFTKRKTVAGTINDIKFTADDSIVMVGDNGYVATLTFAEKAIYDIYSQKSVRTTEDLLFVDSSSSANIILGGNNGALFHFDSDNDSFTERTSGTTATLNGARMLDEGLFYIAADNGESRAEIDSQPQTITLTNRSTLNEAANGQISEMNITGRNLTSNLNLTNIGGATIRSINYISPQLVRVELNVPANATPGEYTPRLENEFGDNVNFTGKLNINAKPSITNAEPVGRLTKGSDDKEVVINGNYFSDNMTYRPTIRFQRDGQYVSDELIRVESLVVDSANRITLKLDIANGIEAGQYRAILTNPDEGTTEFDIDIADELSTDGPVISDIYFDGNRYGASYGTTKKYDIISSTPHIRVKISDGDVVSSSSIAFQDGLDEIPSATITAANYDTATETYTGQLTETLLPGVHVLRISAQDSLGNPGSKDVRVRVYDDEVKIIEGSGPVVSPTPLSRTSGAAAAAEGGNAVTIAYALSKESSDGVDIMVAGPTGGVVAKQTFNTINAQGVMAGYSAGYNEVQLSMPVALGNGIYPGYVRDRASGKTLGKFYIVVKD